MIPLVLETQRINWEMEGFCYEFTQGRRRVKAEKKPRLVHGKGKRQKRDFPEFC